MAWQPARKLFTTTEYHQMIEAGIFGEDDRVELLNGEIIEMSPMGPRHASCVKRLIAVLSDRIKKWAILDVQDPVQLDEYSEPQPDLTLLKPRADFYATAHPTPADVLVAIEVADTTADKDRQIEIPAYALAGIPEVWLIDLFNDLIEVHSKPYKGVYQEVRINQRGQKLVSTVLPQLRLKADQILG